MSILKYEFGDFFNQFTLIQYMGLENLLDYWKNSLIQDFVFLCCFFFGGGGGVTFFSKERGDMQPKENPAEIKTSINSPEADHNKCKCY